MGCEALGPRRILIADDNIDAATCFALLLEATGNEVHTAHDGLEALEAARSWRPDAIFLDIAMPSIDGHEVCRRLREERWAQTVLIVAVTGWGRPEDRRRSLAAGFDHHFVKPVELRQLQELLQSL